MSKTVNVKVSKGKLLDALSKALATKEKEYAEWNDAQEKHKAAIEDIKSTVAERVKEGKMTPTSVDFPYFYRHNSNRKIETISVTFDCAIDLPEVPNFSEHTNNTAQEELRNAIRILELTDEETVRTSSYGAVAKYL